MSGNTVDLGDLEDGDTVTIVDDEGKIVKTFNVDKDEGEDETVVSFNYDSKKEVSQLQK